MNKPTCPQCNSNEMVVFIHTNVRMPDGGLMVIDTFLCQDCCEIFVLSENLSESLQKQLKIGYEAGDSPEPYIEV